MKGCWGTSLVRVCSFLPTRVGPALPCLHRPGEAAISRSRLVITPLCTTVLGGRATHGNMSHRAHVDTVSDTSTFLLSSLRVYFCQVSNVCHPSQQNKVSLLMSCHSGLNLLSQWSPHPSLQTQVFLSRRPCMTVAPPL